MLVTHAHPDHAGGVARLRRAGSSATVASGQLAQLVADVRARRR